MGFILQGLDKEDYDRNYSDKELLFRILSYFNPYKKEMLIITIAVFLSAISNTVVPIFIARSLDVIKASPSPFSKEVLLLAGGTLFFAAFAFFMNMLNQEKTAIAVQSAIRDLRKDAFDQVIDRDLSFLNSQPTGRLVSRLTNDTRDFGTTVTLTTNLMSQLLLVIFITGFLFTISVRLTFFMLMLIPIVFFTALSFRKVARKVALNSNRVLARINALIQETMSGIFVAKSFRAEKAIYDEFDEMNRLSYNINLQRGIVFNSIFPILNILTGMTTAAIVYLGGLEVLNANTILDFLPGRQLTYGEWFLFLQAINYFFFPIIQVASFWSQFQQGLAASERVFSLMDAENTVIQNNSIVPNQLKGKIEFQHLWFAYEPELWVLTDFNLLVPAGQNLAIVGHTGAGKSTIAKLIARFYEFQRGKLIIDDYDIRDLNLKAYRKQLAIISQEVFLFNDSLKNNILYGIRDEEREIAEEKMKEIFLQIDALDWVNNLKEGFDTKVGERGNLLSQGQRQLVALVRTLLRDPAILIMDEATSSVDPFTEIQIQRAANLLMEGRTSIVIAHRLSTVKKADRIIVMKRGKIIESGTHQELLENGGHYAELYDTYFRHQSLEYIEQIARYGKKRELGSR